MVELSSLLSHLHESRILVIGDLMLDMYTKGSVKRVSPEAPVTILNAAEESCLPGGAGNVAVNLLSLGSKVRLLARIGDDAAGAQLKTLLHERGVDVDHLVEEKGYQTPIKNRLIAGGQQLLRVDFEKVAPISDKAEKAMIAQIDQCVSEMELIAISDYGKGGLSHEFLQQVIEMGKRENIPVIVDPKGVDFTKYRGATLIKPNLKEACEAAQMSEGSDVADVAAEIFRRTEIDHLIITRSKDGISCFSPDEEMLNSPVRSKEVKDVTGAGDTVLAVLCIALANQLSLQKAIDLANVAAGLAIERLGCAQISLSDIATSLLATDMTQKVYEEKHLFALQKVLGDGTFVVIGIEAAKGLTSPLFRTLQTVSKKHPEEKLVIYIKDDNSDQTFISLLASLQEVDFIVLHSESLKNLCDHITPSKVYSMNDHAIAAVNSLKTLISLS